MEKLDYLGLGHTYVWVELVKLCVEDPSHRLKKVEVLWVPSRDSMALTLDCVLGVDKPSGN